MRSSRLVREAMHVCKKLVSEQLEETHAMPLCPLRIDAMPGFRAAVALCVLCAGLSQGQLLPLVINTWPFVSATAEAWRTLTAPKPSGAAVLDAVEKVNVKPTVHSVELHCIASSLSDQHLQLSPCWLTLTF